MDTSRLIVWFLGGAALLSLGILAVVSLQQLPAPPTLDHIAVGAISALAGAMTVSGRNAAPSAVSASSPARFETEKESPDERA